MRSGMASISSRGIRLPIPPASRRMTVVISASLAGERLSSIAWQSMTFANWLSREAGGERSWLDRLTLPIGGSAVKDKRPHVIAAMTAAEILTALASYRDRSSS